MSKISIFHPRIFKKLVIGSIFEFGPIFVFLASFEKFEIYKATFFLIIATIISTVVTYKLQKRLPYFALYIALITSIFGYMTLFHHEPRFIQMRDTLYDVTCAFTLIFGLLFNIQFLKIAFNDVLPMTSQSWEKLTYLWIVFFSLVAIANEYVRKNLSLYAWFDFKTTMVFVTILFGIVSLYFFYTPEEKKN